MSVALRASQRIRANTASASVLGRTVLRVVSADARGHAMRDSRAMSDHLHQAPHGRGEHLGDRIEDAAWLLALFSGAAIIVAILLLFVVL